MLIINSAAGRAFYFAGIYCMIKRCVSGFYFRICKTISACARFYFLCVFYIPVMLNLFYPFRICCTPSALRFLSSIGICFAPKMCSCFSTRLTPRIFSIGGCSVRRKFLPLLCILTLCARNKIFHDSPFLFLTHMPYQCNVYTKVIHREWVYVNKKREA